jgi:hypothetical protein
VRNDPALTGLELAVGGVDGAKQTALDALKLSRPRMDNKARRGRTRDHDRVGQPEAAKYLAPG